MCGIAGILNLGESRLPPDLSLLASMIATLRHRGPDEFGFYRDSHAALAHARLTIVDPVTGSQPICNETGTLWIVFNGEIFNYVELRKELIDHGHVFRTRSDTEVILHAWEQWGRECFARFNGQWALAIWDVSGKNLVLSRDRYGVCPLYLRHNGQRLWFASEIKSLFADPECSAKFDPLGLDQLFTFWAPVAPRSMFEGIEQLRPGTVRTYGVDGAVNEWSYWEPDFGMTGEKTTLPFAEAAKELREKLQEAVKLRLLRADVPVGCYLSGGLDSSVVASIAQGVAPAMLKTFSIRFEEEEFDEGQHQHGTAGFLDSDHHEVLVRREDIAAALPDVLLHTECPVLRTAPVPMYILSKLVHSQGIKAVLTGEGADELLGGYDIFREAKIREFWAREPMSTTRPQLFSRVYPWIASETRGGRGIPLAFWKSGLDEHRSPWFSHSLRWRTTSRLKQLLSSDTRSAIAERTKTLAREGGGVDLPLPDRFREWDLLSRGQYLEITTLLGSYLLSSQGDRVLAANSVEGRYPYLDNDVANLAGSLPPFYLLMGLEEKAVLKRAAAGLVPQEILRRKKQPYRSPDAACFFGQYAPAYVAECFSDSSLREADIFDPPAVRLLYEKCARVLAAGGEARMGNSDNMAFVGVLSTQLLYDSMIASKPAGVGPSPQISWTIQMDRLLSSTTTQEAPVQ